MPEDSIVDFKNINSHFQQIIKKEKDKKVTDLEGISDG